MYRKVPDPQQYMSEKARQTEEAAIRGDTRTAYHLTIEIVGKPSIQEYRWKMKMEG